MNTEVAKPRSPLARFKHDLDRLHKAGEVALPSTVPFSAFKNALVVAITDNPSILQCKQESIFKAIRTLAGAGLVPDGREAAIVPFKGQAQAMPMVAGLVKIARNSGKITSLWSDVVLEGEDFDMWVEEGERKFKHNFNPLDRSGEVRGAYAVAKLSDGSIEVEPMGRKEIEKRRMASSNQKSNTPSGIWSQWYEEMAKKTVIRSLCKRLPMSSEDVERLMQEHEPLLRDVTPEPRDDRPTLAQQLMGKEPEPIDGEIMSDDPGFEYSFENVDPETDAYEAGVAASVRGEADSVNPYLEYADWNNWMGGYRFTEDALETEPSDD